MYIIRITMYLPTHDRLTPIRDLSILSQRTLVHFHVSRVHINIYARNLKPQNNMTTCVVPSTIILFDSHEYITLYVLFFAHFLGTASFFAHARYIAREYTLLLYIYLRNTSVCEYTGAQVHCNLSCAILGKTTCPSVGTPGEDLAIKKYILHAV